MSRKEEFSPDCATAVARNNRMIFYINICGSADIEKLNFVLALSNALKFLGEFENLLARRFSRKKQSYKL